MSATVDIETIGPVFDELDEPVRDYLLKRARTALELGLAQIVAIGIHAHDTDKVVALVDGGKPDFALIDATVEGGDERWMLERFWSIIGNKRFKQIVTYNGRGYDGPVLMIRSAQLGVPCGRNLVGYRYSLEHHCDLADALCFQGSVRQFYTLDWWCGRFGIPSPKAEGISGADVARLHREGRRDLIAQYVTRDCRRTTDLFRALLPMLSVFTGGPAISDVQPRPQLALEV